MVMVAFKAYRKVKKKKRKKTEKGVLKKKVHEMCLGVE